MTKSFRTMLILFSALLLVAFLLFSPVLPERPIRHIPVSVGTEDNPHAQAEMEFLIQRDPIADHIPMNIRSRERDFVRRLPTREGMLASSSPTRSVSSHVLDWIERGPDDVGGRTRVFAADVENPDLLIAGSVGGGIWRSLDDGASWSLVTSPGQIHNTVCIAQDTRPGFTNTWYVGTGEFRGSTNNDTRWGSLYRGDGIFKSTDNGGSWTLLPSTSSGTPDVTDPFDYNWNIATDPSNLVQEEVYAATHFGIYRSTDGGGSWTIAQAADASFTDVTVSSTGVVYAFTRNSGVPRIWRSPDGVTWTNIAPASFPTSAGRIIFAVAPSNPNVVYIFVQGANNSPAVAGHQLWKYTYVSGDGSGAGGIWENRAANLPGDINTQTGYDMLVHVKPDDLNFVLIGGTNLYRSTDGFTTSNVATIGGYPFWPQGPHHPDLHGGFFRVDDPNAYYSSHDGGVTKTLDVREPDVSWISLNNGYNVTQFYSVSIAPEAGSNLILAGAQDNGTQLGNAPGVSSWEMAFGGDGTVVKVAPLAHDRLYTQYQGGQIQRMQRDLNNVVFITPNNATNMLFVTPIVLDPNNPAMLYYPAGSISPLLTSAMWRNDDAPNADGSNGWNLLAATDVGNAVGYSRRITALGISTSNSSNVLYYGTVDGIVKRAENAHTPTP
ncbi:MAG: WD40/YVTN/BNR-like repeat-containing protein, partial [Bacteroidota bacterium]